MTDQPEDRPPTQEEWDALMNEEKVNPSPSLDDLPRVIVAASSSWSNHAAIERELLNWWQANGNLAVYFQVGDAPIGGEPMAISTIEKQMVMPVQVWHADRITPAQRDRAMVAAGADVAFVFIENESIGATRVRDLCVAAGIPTIEMTRNTHAPRRPWEDQ